MTTPAQRTVIVTGAAGGIGAAIASNLTMSGWRVFATMRRPVLAQHGPDALALDVTRDDSVNAAVAEVVGRTGRVDAIVNNAGVDMLGAVEETTTEEALKLFETNFFGVHRLTRAVLPIMRAQLSGRIVTIGSIAGFVPTPFNAFYCASKHALNGYCEALDYEIRPFGIRTILIEPGFIRTGLRAKKRTVADSIDAYSEIRGRAGAGFDESVSRGTDPARVAEVVQRALVAAHPKFRQLVGNDARLLNIVYHYLPGFLFKAGMNRQFGIAGR
ncbi:MULTISPECIES: SDR family NAD(P)-dependent oxidoreductase [Sphingosinicellaceae]|uniref:SDR family NAD(P)-dependent oxidoreductase n=1 Tax=Sphingosinicellaceae TaxID=2820280 RepID=UPI001C1E4947|nr:MULTISPECIES: SDR family NAD(P)-dependent oxidoreductase [Polymorphobacter]QYE33517.1 SDR family NAD(P)-dependent oxidoreductase [Polymorphobacter sp. PAMC 29334]UAJ12212.1 SDR family NAD(P)-dependent oxidoreductase [Polymorphobacter megasporae]